MWDRWIVEGSLHAQNQLDSSSWLVTDSWSVVTLQLHYLAGIVVQLVSTILTIFIDRASRGPSAVAELLVEN